VALAVDAVGGVSGVVQVTGSVLAVGSVGMLFLETATAAVFVSVAEFVQVTGAAGAEMASAISLAAAASARSQALRKGAAREGATARGRVGGGSIRAARPPPMVSRRNIDESSSSAEATGVPGANKPVVSSVSMEWD